MHQSETDRIEEAVDDLGAASALTRGFWDPMMWETHVVPEARDF